MIDARTKPQHNSSPFERPLYHSGPFDLKRKCIIYVRVSTKRDHMVSPQQQDAICRSFALMNGLEVVAETVEDIDLSGRSFDKRKIASLIERVAAGEFGTILVWQYSRWARNAGLGLAHINMLEQAGGQLLAVTEAADSRTAVGVLQRGIMLQFAEYFSNVMGEGWKQTHARRIAMGLPSNGRRRFGYDRCPKCRRREDKPEAYLFCADCEGVQVIDPMRGPWLGECYSMYLKGGGFVKIANTLSTAGITAISGKTVGRKVIMQIMDTGFAAGLICTNTAVKIGEGEYRKLGFQQYMFHPGAHEPIIDMDTWENYLDRRVELFDTTPRARYAVHSTSGLFRCGEVLESGETCMGGMIFVSDRLNMRCANSVVFGKKSCPGAQVPKEFLEDEMRKWLESRAHDDGSALHEMQEAARADRLTARIEDLKAARDKTEARWRNLQDAYVEKAVDLAYFNDKKAQILGELAAFSEQIKEIEGTQNKKKPTPVEFSGMLDVWEKADDQEKNRLLSTVVAYALATGKGRGKFKRPDVTKIVPRWEEAPIKKLRRNPANLTDKEAAELRERREREAEAALLAKSGTQSDQ